MYESLLFLYRTAKFDQFFKKNKASFERSVNDKFHVINKQLWRGMGLRANSDAMREEYEKCLTLFNLH